MREVGDITPKIIDHWSQYKEQCEQGLIRANQQLSRLAIASSGQLQLEFYLTKKEEQNDFIQDQHLRLLPNSNEVSG